MKCILKLPIGSFKRNTPIIFTTNSQKKMRTLLTTPIDNHNRTYTASLSPKNNIMFLSQLFQSSLISTLVFCYKSERFIRFQIFNFRIRHIKHNYTPFTKHPLYMDYTLNKCYIFNYYSYRPLTLEYQLPLSKIIVGKPKVSLLLCTNLQYFFSLCSYLSFYT